MYTQHFGLSEPPFSMTPDPRYVYMSEAHREALAHLLYGIGEGGGFVQLTGEVGTGKTTLCRCLLEQLPRQVDVALVLNPRLTDVELLAAVCDELRIVYPAGTTSRKLLVDTLYRYLLDAHTRGRRTVLIVDEAQDLERDVLEQIRLLTNLETATDKLLQIILIGQPELLRLLDEEGLRQVAQRVTARYHLLPFSEEDTRAYIRHRTEVAGRKEPIFSDGAMGRVHRFSRGIPRLINAICDRALLGAYTQEERRVSAATVRRAAREVFGQRPGSGASRLWRWAGGAVAGIALVGGAWLWLGHAAPSSIGPVPLPAWPLRATVVSVPADSPSAADDQPGRVSAPEASTPGIPVANARPVPAGTPAPRRLGDMLSDPLLRADKRSAFVSLYAAWGLDYDSTKDTLGCERGRAQGLQCLFKTGTWAKLRRFDVPAIIELSTPLGERRYATVVALDENTASLDLGGRRYTFPLSEVDLYWDGPFMLLWKAPALGSLPIVPGMRSRDVEWVRQRLAELDGGPVASKNRDVFDEELRARVVAFQRSRSLPADGIVGEETLTQLSAAQRDPSVPRLWRAGS